MFFFKKESNGKRPWKNFGIGGTVIYLILFSIAILPYIGEWIHYLSTNFEYLFVLSAFISFGAHVSGKVATIRKLQADQKAQKEAKARGETIGISGGLRSASQHVLVALGL